MSVVCFSLPGSELHEGRDLYLLYSLIHLKYIEHHVECCKYLVKFVELKSNSFNIHMANIYLASIMGQALC